MTSFAPSAAPSSENTTASSLFVKELARNGSPPLREDDKDGHYMFELGENLTSRCNYTLTIINSFSLLVVDGCVQVHLTRSVFLG